MIEFAEMLVEGFYELQGAAVALSDQIEGARERGDRSLRVDLAEFLPPFVQEQVRSYVGPEFLEALIGIEAFQVDLSTGELSSRGESGEEVAIDLSTLLDLVPDFLAWLIETAFGHRIDVHLARVVTAELDLGRLADGTLAVSDLTGVEIRGLSDPQGVVVDTRNASFQLDLAWPAPNIEVALELVLDKIEGGELDEQAEARFAALRRRQRALESLSSRPAPST